MGSSLKAERSNKKGKADVGSQPHAQTAYTPPPEGGGRNYLHPLYIKLSTQPDRPEQQLIPTHFK
jgi:hypothetical protein